MSRRAQDWPDWKIVTRCLDCAYVREDVVNAPTESRAKAMVAPFLPPATREHKHRFVHAAGCTGPRQSLFPSRKGV